MDVEYKKILLLKGLPGINDEHFRIVKSLLTHDLKLSELQRSSYDRIKIGEMMADKFRGAACVDKFIELIRGINELKDLVDKLKKEKLKVARKFKAKSTTQKQQKAAEPRRSSSRSSTSRGTEEAPRTQKRKCTAKEKTRAKRNMTQGQRRPADSAQASASQPAQTPASQPAQTPASQVAQTPASQAAQTPASQPAQTPASQPAQTPASQAAQTPASQPAQTSAPHPSQVPAPQLTQASVSRAVDLPETLLNSASAPASCSSSSVGLSTNQRMPGPQKTTTRRCLPQKDPVTVRVLKTSKPFEYCESSEKHKHTMFHATVVTAKQFFHVKVFNISLMKHFTKMKILTISDYFKCKGTLEIRETSSVTEVSPDVNIEVPNCIIKKANETPKINKILKQASGTLVYGLFKLHKKKVNRKKTVYEVQDKTGKMNVIGEGKYYNLNCNEGDKLRLYCFQLSKRDQKFALMCGTHSFIKVIKTRRDNRTHSVNLHLQTEEVTLSPAPSQSDNVNCDSVEA